MPGMGTSLQTDNATVISAFKSALFHQGLVVLVILALLAVAWNLLRGLQLRQVTSAGGPVPRIMSEPTVPEPAALRLLRIAFGCIWIFDGILQAQVSMPLGLASGVIQPAASSSPVWVAAPRQRRRDDLEQPSGLGGRFCGLDPGRHRRVGCSWRPRGNWSRLAGARQRRLGTRRLGLRRGVRLDLRRRA